MIVLKLGGSLLTDKSRYRKLRAANVARLAREVAGAERAVALVHGAGSFGHVVAKEHALADGRRGDRGQDAAAARVHRDVRELHLAVLDALAAAGARAVGVATWDVARLRDGALDAFDAAPYARALDAGLTPVGFGDLAPDATRGYGILSGDVVVERLALALKPERVVFATDVDGVYDRPPEVEGASLLARLTADEAVRALAGGSRGVAARSREAARSTDDPPLRSGVVDVTGGMKGKVARLAAVARAGVPVLVVNGLVAGRVADALAGRDVVGTVVRPA